VNNFEKLGRDGPIVVVFIVLNILSFFDVKAVTASYVGRSFAIKSYHETLALL
jgi:hypothetical protein